jgi:ABC-2 type transport system ATP-binding protein
MTAPVLQADGLGKRYRRRLAYGKGAYGKGAYGKWALRDCSLSVPAGRVAALVGPNGAGKTTLLHLAVGLLAPTEGEVQTLGAPVRGTEENRAGVAFLPQDKPLYRRFTVADMLRFGRELNPRWDDALAVQRLAELDIPITQKVGSLSGGQRTQVALTVAAARHPDLLVLDEPLADLDPLARHEVMRRLMETVAETSTSAVLSSHVVADLADTCDWLILLQHGRVQLSADVDELLTAHTVLTGPADHADDALAGIEVVERTGNGRQVSVLAETNAGPPGPSWTARPVQMEELVLAYLRRPRCAAPSTPTLAVAG